MNKEDFTDRLILAGNTARKFAETLDYVNVKLPDKLVFTLQEYNDQLGRQSKNGKLKFLGGRFIDPSELKCLSASNAASLLWVGGKVPSWINVLPKNYTADTTEIELLFSKSLVPAEEEKLAPDYGMEFNNPLVPFRIRGPWMQEWIKMEKMNSNWFRRIVHSALSTIGLGGSSKSS